MMKLSQWEYENYTAILREELIPAMGCTEPIAIAYAAAVTRKLLGEMPTHITVNCSGNMIKNVKGVTVPNSGGQKGIEVAAILGMVGGDPNRKLEVIAGVTDEDREACRDIAASGICEVNLAEQVPNLYIEVCMQSEAHTACVRIAHHHTESVYMEKDRKVLQDVENELMEETASGITRADRRKMSLEGLLTYADTVDLAEVRDILQRQIEMNSAISQEGLDNAWGAEIGKTILENWGSDVRTTACAAAAAGSDARMSGCPLPVVINSGSGNQGITVTMPVLVYAREWHISEEKMERALLVSNLVSIYIKHYIGALSAFCGAVSASCGAGAGITYLSGGDYPHIGRTITNTIANVGGIVCDGAKPSCAAKIAASVHAALLAHYMSVSDKQFKAGEGIVEKDVEETIKNMGYIGRVGMKSTDKEILNVMIDKADVNSNL